MRKTLLLFALTLFISCGKNTTSNENTQPIKSKENTQQIEVLTLGSFHFNFPNLDIRKISKKNQIDVLEPKYQAEIKTIVDKLEKFKPTIIAIEREPENQAKYDSLYNAYLDGNHKLARNEEQQIGFRLAKRLGLKKLFCTDAWGIDYEYIDKAVYKDDTIARNKFLDFFYNNPDSIIRPFRNQKSIFKKEGILPELKRINSPEWYKYDLGNYLIGIFKYETEENIQFGPDYVTGWWFNRNLRIFRNIQRIEATSEDRILVIYGAGHMNLLNVFFETSPEYKLLKVNDFLN